MSYLVRPNTPLPKPAAWTVNRASEAREKPAHTKIITRRVDLSWLDEDGTCQNKTAIAPSMPIFEEAFSALAQGTLIQTPEGLVAVEDLLPGDRIATADGPAQRIRWIGSMTVLPNASSLGLEESSLYRLTEGSFGLQRGGPDLVLGHAARILPGLLAINSSSQGLTRVTEMVDGQSVISIRPAAPIRLFHICLASHRLIRANGVLVETYHPGPNAQVHLSQELFGHFMGLFPHVKSLSDFGPLNHKR